MDLQKRQLVDVERSNALLFALSRVATKFSSTFSPDDMLEMLAQELKALELYFYFSLLDPDRNVAEIEFVSPGRKVTSRLEKVFGEQVIGYQLNPEQWPPMAVKAIEQRGIIFVEDFYSDAQQLFLEFSESLTQLGLDLANISSQTKGIHLAHEFRDGTVGVLTIWGVGLREIDMPIFSIFGSEFASIYEKVLLYEAEQKQSTELRTANRFLEALSQVAASVARVSDIETVINSMGDELRKIGLDSLVVLLDPETNEGYIRYHSIFPSAMKSAELITNRVFTEQRLPLHDWPEFIQQVLINSKVIYVEKFRDSVIGFMGPGVPKIVAKLANKFIGIGAETKGFYLPLKSQEKVFGCLSIWDDNLNKNYLSALKVFSHQVAIAFENARLLTLEQLQAKKLSRANALLAALSRITSRVSAKTNHEVVIEVVEEELQTIGLSSAGFLVNNVTSEVTLLKHSAEEEWMARFTELVGLSGENLSFSVADVPIELLTTFQEHKVLFIKELEGYLKNILSGYSKGLLSRSIRQAGILPETSGIAFPFYSEGDSILGIIVWGNELENEDVGTFRIYQSQIRSVLETVRLYQNVEAENLERRRIELDLMKYKEQLEIEVRDRTNELHLRNLDLENEVAERRATEDSERKHRAFSEALENTAYVLNQTQDLDEILDRILVNLESVVIHDSANIMLVDETGNAYVARYKGNPQEPESDERRDTYFSVDETPTLFTMSETLKPILISNVKSDQNWIAHKGSAWIRSYLGTPIFYGQTVLGYLNIVSSKNNHFQQIDAERLLAFANHASIAIRNSQLFSQAKELAAMEERQRIARDMHDAVSQTLFTASMVAEALPLHWERSEEKGLEGLVKLKTLTKGALAELRTILLELRPEALVSSDLGALIEQLVVGAMSYLEVSFTINIEGTQILPGDVQIGIFRIAQEVISNIVKHARASHVEVDFLNRGSSVHLMISDNGIGFSPEEEREDRFGLKIMHERANLIGAQLEISSDADNGTTTNLDWLAPDEKEGSGEQT